MALVVAGLPYLVTRGEYESKRGWAVDRADSAVERV